MRNEILCFFQEIWNRLKKVLADKRGDFSLGNIKPEGAESIEREIVINDTRIHIKSIFTGQTRLDEAMKKSRAFVLNKLKEMQSENYKKIFDTAICCGNDFAAF